VTVQLLNKSRCFLYLIVLWWGIFLFFYLIIRSVSLKEDVEEDDKEEDM
jgi:hypothetical protein